MKIREEIEIYNAPEQNFKDTIFCHNFVIVAVIMITIVVAAAAVTNRVCMVILPFTKIAVAITLAAAAAARAEYCVTILSNNS